MSEFFNDDVLLRNEEAKKIYAEIKDLPIIDYHCHLDDYAIKRDDKFDGIGELWLKGDHYKWRAMRLCGVDEEYITGSKSYEEKFYAFCKIMPKIVGNPVYYWAHFELRQIFGIDLEINEANAKEIYRLANEKLKDLSVRKLLNKFNVEYVATTDDPTSSLPNHGDYGNLKIRPTFRPDKLYNFDQKYLDELGAVVGFEIKTLTDLEKAICLRLDFFRSKGGKITDHGFKDFPSRILTKEQAEVEFQNRNSGKKVDFEGLFGYLMHFLMKEYKKRNMIVQLHFAVTRNINLGMFNKLGVDSGFDVIGKEINLDNLILFLQSLEDEERPTIILYTLNPQTIPAIACISGAFRNVYVGAAWWFNDTLLGIENNLKLITEYSVLGTNLGMLTDSRSFSSYSRFDFFRRILSTFLGKFVKRGECTLENAIQVAKDISYYNIKKLLEL